MAAAAIGAMHLSRLAEEVVIWCTAPFGFIRLSDAFTTGSSIMPQKRNPDAAELVRAKSGRVTGALVALLTVMKGLPLAYAKDMQEDKEPVFDAAGRLGVVARGDRRNGARHDARMWRACGRRRATALRRRRISPTGLSVRSGCRSATRTMSPAGWWRCRGEAARIWRS